MAKGAAKGKGKAKARASKAAAKPRAKKVSRRPGWRHRGHLRHVSCLLVPVVAECRTPTLPRRPGVRSATTQWTQWTLCTAFASECIGFASHLWISVWDACCGTCAGAYIFFGISRRPELVKKNPELAKKVTEVSKVLGEEWKKMTDKQKAPFGKEGTNLPQPNAPHTKPHTLPHQTMRTTHHIAPHHIAHRWISLCVLCCWFCVWWGGVCRDPGQEGQGEREGGWEWVGV